MKIKISIEKEYAYVIGALLLVIVAGIAVTAYNYAGYTSTSAPEPGHSAQQVWVTLPDGSTKTLQDAIDLSYDQGGLKPIKGDYEYKLFKDSDIGSSTNPTDLGNHFACMITTRNLVDSNPSVCATYKKDDGKWYAHQSGNVDCEVVCIKWK